MNDKGVFTGIGVGPGDPGLVTVKAIKTIEKADVLMLPSADKDNCKAYNIVKQAFVQLYECDPRAVDRIESKECIFEPFPMMNDSKARERFHRQVADRVVAILDKGRDVIFLTIGDPAVYSTFDYIALLLAETGHEIRRISGVTSFCETANRLGISLGEDTDEIHIIPGRADIDEALKLNGTKVFMKSGKKLSYLKSRLAEYEKSGCRVMGIANCGLADEKIAYSLSEIGDDWGYLSVIICR